MSKPPGLPTPKCAANSGLSDVTRAVRAGIECDDESGCVVPPLHLTSTFAFRAFGENRGYDYTRSGNPTRELLGQALAELEGGAGGRGDRTGMAAVTLCRYCCPRREHRRAARLLRRDLGCSRRCAAPRQRQVEFVDFGDDGGAARGARRARSGAVDRDAEQSAAAHDRHRGASRSSRSGRYAGRWSTTHSCRRPSSGRWRSAPTSWCTRPPSTSTATATWSAARWWQRDPELAERLRLVGNASGLTGAPFEAGWRCAGCARCTRASRSTARNAPALAEWLAGQRRGAPGLLPGPATHPGHELARRQQTGFGAIVTLRARWRDPAVQGIGGGHASASRSPSRWAASRA